MLAAERLAESALHRLSQPLTAMRCLLEYALEQEEPEVLRDFSSRSMQECARLAAMVHAFRELLMMGVRSHETELLTLEEVLQVAAKAGVVLKNSTTQLDLLLRLNPSSLATALWHLRESVNVNANADAEAECECVVSERAVVLRWKTTGTRRIAPWVDEQVNINPFAVTNYDFIGAGIPRLTIVKTIAEAMGGDLYCSDDVMELRLPREAGDAMRRMPDPIVDGVMVDGLCSQ